VAPTSKLATCVTKPTHRQGEPVKFQAKASPARVPATGAKTFWQRLVSAPLDFAGFRTDATFLWTRWLVLRAVGVVFIFIFAGIIAEGQAFLAPNGIAQLGEFFDQLHKTFPSTAEALIRAPSLFWVSTSPLMISLLAWGGLIAAMALVLNLWPRLTLFVCWLFFLSFASTWRAFSPAQLDNLMLEVALLCLPFTPPGKRPGLGASAAPRPIVIFMLRWLLFRVMFEDGVVKLASGDPHWRDFTAMEVMYETSPFPTILGFIDHQLPHWYHLGEIALTFFAELIAPVLAIWGGRRGRWIAFISWVLLQAGIQLTNNFGWLNTAAIGLGLILLDDQMLAAAAAKLRLPHLAERIAAGAQTTAVAPLSPWARRTLTGALWVHFYLGIFYFVKAFAIPPVNIPRVLAAPADWVKEFRSVNGYYLYATFEPVRFQVEFLGSNDGGRTWRTYEYRNIPQRVDRVAPFLAPWFCRFEATMEIEGWSGRKSPVIPAVAAHLLAGNQNVIALFARNPFPDRPPTLLRMRGYRMAFADWATQRTTGAYWRRELDGDYHAMLALDDRGQLVEYTLDEADAALARRDVRAAIAILERQYEAKFLPAGFRLADIYLRGIGVPRDPTKAFALYNELAKEGEVAAEHYLGICYESGIGVSVDYTAAAHWYGRAAARGYLPGIFSLGALYAGERVTPADDVAGLAWLLEAGERAKGDDPNSRFVRERQPALVKKMTDRMSATAVESAKRRAADRPLRRGLRP
jgi:hypothetical protein